MTVSLLRHGKTAANAQRLYCGQTDVDVSETGIVELLELKKTVAYPSAKIFAASGLKRTVTTLEILYGVQPSIIIPELMEYDFGSFEMKSHDELEHDPSYIKWIANEDARCPGGESRTEFHTRIRAGFDRLKTISGTVCICHGGVIATLMESLFPGKRGFYEWQPGFGRGYAVTYGADISFTAI